jgi:RNA polymerase sigma factor (sigma-70 family)
MSPTERELQLLDQLGWVRQLARSLVRDPGQVDDLVQEAWLAAATGGPGVQDTQGLRRWLSAVVSNLARKQARGADRRARREGAVARPEAVDEDIVARGALHRELADAVLQLAEPQRSAILLRYLDGLSAIEIAQRQGVSHDAARKRISRGLAELRTRLDAARGGDRQAWLSALSAWLERAEELGPRAAPAAPLAPWGSAGLWKLGLAAAAVLLTALGWYVIDPFSAQSPRPEYASAFGGALPPEGLQAPVREMPRAAMDSTQAAADFTLADEGGAPRGGFSALFLDGGRLIETVRSDADGKLRGPAHGSADGSPGAVLVAREGFEPVRFEWTGQPGPHVLVIHSGRSVDGRVTGLGDRQPDGIVLSHDRPQRALAGLDARALAELARLGIEEGQRRVALSVHGDFAFQGLDAAWTGALELPDGWSFSRAAAPAALGSDGSLLFLEPASSLLLEALAPLVVAGRLVEARARTGVSGALVRIDPAGADPDPRSSQARSTADGRFELSVPRPRHPGEDWLARLLVEAGGVQLDRTLRIPRRDLEAGRGLGEIEIALGRALQVRVRDEHAAPVAGAVVSAQGASERLHSPPTDEQGTTLLCGVDPACAELIVTADGCRPARAALHDSNVVEVALVAANRLDVRVVTEAGLPARELLLRVECARSPFDLDGWVDQGQLQGPFAQVFDIDGEGRRVFSALLPGLPLSLVAVKASGGELARLELITPGPGAALAVELSVPQHGQVCGGRVLDDRGRALPRTQILIECGADGRRCSTDADGRFFIAEDLCGQTAEHFEVQRPGFVPAVMKNVVLSAEHPLEIVLEQGRALEVALSDADGRSLSVGSLWASFDEGAGGLARELEPGVYRFELLPMSAGKLNVELGGVEYSTPLDALVGVARFTLPATGLLQLRVADGVLDRGTMTCVAIQALDRDGIEARQYFRQEGDGRGAWSTPLAAGRYRLQLEQRRWGRGKPKVELLGQPREVEIVAGQTMSVTVP